MIGTVGGGGGPIHKVLVIAVAILASTIQHATGADSSSDNVIPPKRSHRKNLSLTDSRSTSTTYLITFTDEEEVIDPTKRCEALAKALGAKLNHVYKYAIKGCSLILPPGEAQEAYMALSNYDAIDTVEFDRPIYPAVYYEEEASSSPGNIFDVSPIAPGVQASAVAPSWGLDRINQCTLPLDDTVTKQNAEGVKVYIIDTGIYAEHQEFANGVIGPEDCHKSIFPNEDPLTDVNGHGTHVAGTACGAQYGVSDNCTLCAVKVFNATGHGTVGGAIAGIDHVVSQCTNATTGGSRCVVNLSLTSKYVQSFDTSVANAVAKGVVMVVAAGNNASDACVNTSPASTASAFTVGATSITDKRSSFSNWGKCVDVYAPGSSIISASIDDSTASTTKSGTSMASPHVAGIAAAIRSSNPTWNATQVRDAIVKSAAAIPQGLFLATVDDVNCTSLPTTPPSNSPTTTTASPTPTKPTPNQPSFNPTTVQPTSNTTRSARPTLYPTSAQPTTCTNGTAVEIKITTDKFPLETAWTITHKCGAGSINSPPYTAPSTLYSTNLCLTRCSSYKFTITDSYGDGLCCDWGNGGYEIIVDGSSVHSGGEFFESKTELFEKPTDRPSLRPSSSPTASNHPTFNPTISFEPTPFPTISLHPTITSDPTNFPTLNPTPAPTPCPAGTDFEVKIRTDNFPNETAWTLSHKCGAGAIINSPNYTAPLTLHSSKICLPSCVSYKFTITDSYGDGLCCNSGDGSYELLVDGRIVHTGGQFLGSETTFIHQSTNHPSFRPSSAATDLPTNTPSYSSRPTFIPPSAPTTSNPTSTEGKPTLNPSSAPQSFKPTNTDQPTLSRTPSAPTTSNPTSASGKPTLNPSSAPQSFKPTNTDQPTLSRTPSAPTTSNPTSTEGKPTLNPSSAPQSFKPTNTDQPTISRTPSTTTTSNPTSTEGKPTYIPSPALPTYNPTTSYQPTISRTPSALTTSNPTGTEGQPTFNPSSAPPTFKPTKTDQPTLSPIRADRASSKPTNPIPTLSTCTDGTNVEVKIKTDMFPQETAWTITHQCGAGTITNSPPYTAAITLYSTKLCLPKCSSYKFTITDSQGDGLCCKWGTGRYDILVDGWIVHSGGYFLDSETKVFGPA